MKEIKTNIMGHTRLVHRFESKPEGINLKRHRREKYTHTHTDVDTQQFLMETNSIGSRDSRHLV